MNTIPMIRKPIAITSGGPSPNQESPDSEFSGLDEVDARLDEDAASIRPPISGATPTRKKFLTLLNELRRKYDEHAKPVSP